MGDLHDRRHTACDYVALIKAGRLTSEALTEHCLEVIERTDTDIRAWRHLDPEHALEQARRMDDVRRRGRPTGALHGIPVGIKDIFDTADMPTEYGTKIYAGNRPDRDSAVVERLREAGAVILGKTVTTELAYMDPAETRNPHNLKYSPGGSSSGSAAAVAAGQVAVAIGSQTHGSTIRPASFCGIYGMKPSRGIISRRGALETAPSLDQVGIFAADAADLALVCDAISGYDYSDSASYLDPKPQMLAGYLSDAPMPPSLAWFDMPYKDRYHRDVEEGFGELMATLAGRVERLAAPRSFAGLLESLRIIYSYELYHALHRVRTEHLHRLGEAYKKAFAEAESISDEQYNDALAAMRACDDWFARFFNDFDAILTPAALGEAPLMSANSTGEPTCSTIWTLAGLPCISLPLLTGSGNLPVGVQLVGAAGEDDRLLRTARWMLETLRAQG